DEFGGSAVISRRLAMEMYGTLDVIGKGFPKNRPQETIVGIVGDARLAQSEDPNGAAFYAPLNPKRSSRTLIARAKANPEHLLPLMRESARAYDDKILPDAHSLAKDFAARCGGDARAVIVL